ncbi:hypothetical protein [Moorena bouillonii]|nr:hypothetical protein [Moorena bouillonii]
MPKAFILNRTIADLPPPQIDHDKGRCSVQAATRTLFCLDPTLGVIGY